MKSSLPPSDVAPSALFRKLLETPEPSEVIDFPRRTPSGKTIGQTRIRVLTHQAQDDARFAALKDLRERMKDHNLREDDIMHSPLAPVYSDAVARHLLAMACLTPEAANADLVAANPDDVKPIYGRIFPNAKAISEQLTSDEIVALFSAYELTQRKYGPQETMDQEHVDAWVLRLTEGAETSFLSRLAWLDLAELTLHLARRVSSLSQILLSQHSISVSTSGPEPETLTSDTIYAGSQPSEQASSESSSSPPSEQTPKQLFEHVLDSDEPITLEQALQVARYLADKNQG